MGKFITQNNMTKLGLEHLKSFATRGVIVDMVKVFQQAGKLKGNPACKKPCLDKGTVITAADIQAGLKMYNVTLREGDIVIIHTGWGDLFEQYPGAERALQLAASPASARTPRTWLASQKVVAVGADTWGVEVIPGEDPKEAFIVHNILLTDNGIHIIENVRTDLMAAEAASDEPRDVLLQHDGAQGGRADGQLRGDRRHPLGAGADRYRGRAGRRRLHTGRRRSLLRAALAVAAWPRGARRGRRPCARQERRYTRRLRQSHRGAGRHARGHRVHRPARSARASPSRRGATRSTSSSTTTSETMRGRSPMPRTPSPGRWTSTSSTTGDAATNAAIAEKLKARRASRSSR